MSNIQKFDNNAETTLASILAIGATTMTVAVGEGALFKEVVSPDYELATIENSGATLREIVKITAHTLASDSFTIERAQEGTSDLAWAIADKVEVRLTEEGLNRFPQIDPTGSSIEIGADLKNVLPNSTVIRNPIVVPDPVAQSITIDTAQERSSFLSGTPTILTTEEIDLTVVAGTEISLPTNFYVEEVGVLSTEITGLTTQPTISFGSSDGGAEILAASLTTVLTQANRLQRYTSPLLPEVGHSSSIFANVSTAGVGTSVKGRFYFKGFFIGGVPIAEVPIAQYKLDETSGLIAVDFIGAVNGTISGGVTLDKTGISGTSMFFDGVDDGINLGTNFAFERTDSFSISAWIKTSSASNQDIFAKQESSVNFTGYGFTILTSGAITAGIINTVTTNQIGITTTATTFSDGSFHLVTMTYDGSSTAAGTKIYVDGALQAVTIDTDNLSASILNAEEASIGKRFGGISFFNGNIDDVRIYNSELTSLEVTDLYSTYDKHNVSLLSHYRLDETSGLVATDSGGSVDGTISGGVTLNQAGAKASTNTSFLFDGISGKIEASTSDLVFERTDSFSFSAWVNTSDFTNFPMIISKRDAVSPNAGYEFNISSTGQVTLSLTNSLVTSNALSVSSVSTISLNTWTHVAATYDGSSLESGVSLYIDGVLQTKTDIVDTLTSSILTPLINFGIGFRGTGLFFPGLIDDVRIYNSELSALDVAAIFAE